ncbi:hypothetical protein ANN_13948 [Periplaneta americana]|uniref:Uncharacterized protein n=1 Tax=Periplaneta americana TaxID=6978 RepID=A0ABQ8SUY7_PERAM|nr:hypothetical protein ANN_13948 [Periplaneta americana]
MKLHNTELHALYSSPDIIRNIKSRRLRWAGHVARMGESRNAYRVLVGRPEGKRPLGRPRRRWEDNIEMDLREVGYDDRDWIDLSQGVTITVSDLSVLVTTRFSTLQQCHTCSMSRNDEMTRETYLTTMTRVSRQHTHSLSLSPVAWQLLGRSFDRVQAAARRNLAVAPKLPAGGNSVQRISFFGAIRHHPQSLLDLGTISTSLPVVWVRSCDEEFCQIVCVF